MNSPPFGLRVAGTIFGLVCLAHLVRLVLRFQLMLGSYAVPLWMNGVAFVITGLLAFWLWHLSMSAGLQVLTDCEIRGSAGYFRNRTINPNSRSGRIHFRNRNTLA